MTRPQRVCAATLCSILLFAPAARPGSPPVDAYGDPLPAGAIARIGTTRLRANASINAVAFSPDGRRLAYGAEFNSVYVCEAADGKLVHELHPYPNYQPITEVAFSPDGRTVAVSGYWSDAGRLIDLATGKVTHTFPNSGANQNKRGREWQGPGFAFTPDGRTLVVGGKDGAVHLWDIATATEPAALKETDEPVLSLLLTADGRTALTAHSCGELHLWDVARRKHRQKPRADARYPQFTALSPDGKMVALAQAATELELWDAAGGRRHQLTLSSAVAGLAFTPDGTALQTADADGQVTTWDVRTGQKCKTLNCEGMPQSVSDIRMGPKPAAWFRADGKALAWVDGGVVRLWDLVAGKETPRLAFFRQGITWAGFSPDGRLVRAGGMCGELGVWDAATGRPHGKPQPLTERAPLASYAPAADRAKVIVVLAQKNPARGQHGAGRVHVWDPAGAAFVPLQNPAGPAWYGALTPDHRFIVATEPGAKVHVHDAASGKRVRSFEGQTPEYHPTFSPDGKLLATTGLAARLYDFATGQVLRECKGKTSATCLAFSPDGGTLATGHLGELPSRTPGQPPADLIYLWQVSSGSELRRIATGHDWVNAVAFSPDGRLIASSGVDRTVRLWETASGQERRHYDGHATSVLLIPARPMNH